MTKPSYFSTLAAFLAVAFSILLGSSTNTHAQLIYGGGTETATRFNPGAGAITYMNCFVPYQSGAQLVLNQVEVGIRRIAVAGALLDVGLNIYAAEMTFDGVNFGRGTNVLIHSTPSLGGGAASVTQLVSTAPNLGTTLNFETVSNPTLGGFWIGVEFTGPNAGNTQNGWRIVNAPTTGASINAFGLFNNAGSGIFQSFFAFGTPPGSSPSRFLVNVQGVPEPTALLLAGLPGLVLSLRRRRA